MPWLAVFTYGFRSIFPYSLILIFKSKISKNPASSGNSISNCIVLCLESIEIFEHYLCFVGAVHCSTDVIHVSHVDYRLRVSLSVDISTLKPIKIENGEGSTKPVPYRKSTYLLVVS